MRTRASFGSGTPRTSAIWPRAVQWSLIAFLAVAGLLGLGWLLGTAAPKFRGSITGPLEKTLRSGIVSAIVAAALAVVLLWAVRRVYLCWLTYRPGPICVLPFTPGDGDDLKPLTESLTLRFRQTLSGLYLDAQASSQPAASEASDFASLVGAASLDPKQAFASAMALIRAAAPTHAYEVSGVLRQRDEAPRYGIAIQVLVRPKNARVLELCWEPTWERAIERAANTAAAFILPQTARCRLAPWRTWRHYVMAPRVLDAYERASACVEKRRYEEALGLFREALEEDPMNLDIRLRMGMVQEQLGLFMDAFDTYVAMEAIQLAPQATAAHGRSRMHSLGARERTRQRTAEVALYRRAVLLGGGQVAEQWLRWQEDAHGPRTARDRQREVLRRRLEPWFKDLSRPEFPAENPLEVLPVYDNEQLRDKTARLKAYLADVALEDLEHLETRAWKGAAWRFRSTPLSSAAVATSKECVKLRGRIARGEKTEIEGLTNDLEGALGKKGGRTWEAQYNAGCLYAIALGELDPAPSVSGGNGVPDEIEIVAEQVVLTDKGILVEEVVRTEHMSQIPEPSEVERVAEGREAGAARQDLIDAAMRHLKIAIRSTDSGYVANRAPWLLREDPDLTALRRVPEFKWLEANYFVRDHREGQDAPEDRHRAALREHTKQLCAGYAQRLEELWHHRADDAKTVDVHDAGHWWGRELEAWQLIAELAVEYMDWETRLRAIDKLRSWAQEAGIQPLEIPYPPPRHWSPDATDSEARIGLPADVVRKDGPLMEHLVTVDDKLRRVDRRGERLMPQQFAHVARCQAALWQTLREDIEPRRLGGKAAGDISVESDLGNVLHDFRAAQGERAALMTADQGAQSSAV